MRNQKELDKGIVAICKDAIWHCLLCNEERQFPTGMLIHLDLVHKDRPGQFGLIAKKIVDLGKFKMVDDGSPIQSK